MNKRLISRLMHERVSGLKSSGVYFFRGDFWHVLYGVVLDYTPYGLYIEEFRFPLFDFGGPNLLYSGRLADGAYIEKGAMSEDAIVDFVMARPEVQRVFGQDASMTLERFVEYLRESNALLNPHAQLIQAASLVLMDQASEAMTLLDEIRTRLHRVDVPHWERFHHCLRMGPDAALQLLDEVRQKNLTAFGLRY